MEVIALLLAAAAVIGFVAWRLTRGQSSNPPRTGGGGGRPSADHK